MEPPVAKPLGQKIEQHPDLHRQVPARRIRREDRHRRIGIAGQNLAQAPGASGRRQ
jgi:hypothetical protein